MPVGYITLSWMSQFRHTKYSSRPCERYFCAVYYLRRGAFSSMSSSVSSEERWEMSLRLGGQTEGKFEVRRYGETSSHQTQDHTGKIIIILFVSFFFFLPNTGTQSNLIKRHHTKSKSSPQLYLKWQEWALKTHPFSSQIEVSLAFRIKQGISIHKQISIYLTGAKQCVHKWMKPPSTSMYFYTTTEKPNSMEDTHHSFSSDKTTFLIP